MNMAVSSGARAPQQCVFLLALAQQQILAADPVVRGDRARDVVDAALIDVDPALLDAAARFALGFGESRTRHEIHERQILIARDLDGRDLAGEDVEYLRVDFRLLLAEENRRR